MSSRRPRYGEDDDFSEDEDPRPAHHSRESRSRRPPTPPDDDADAGPPRGHGRRKSILKDPDEDPKERSARRSNSKVRVKPPPSAYHSSDDEGSIDGRYVKHRNGKTGTQETRPPTKSSDVSGKVEFIPADERKREPKRRTHDLEKKDDEQSKSFRNKRDGYESDEGDMLKKSKVRDRGGDLGDVDDEPPRGNKLKGRSGFNDRDAEHGRHHKSDREDNAYVLPDRSRRGGDSRRDDDYGGDKRRDHGRRRMDSDDDEPPKRHSRPSRQPRDADYERGHDRGYDTEGARRNRRGWDDDDRDYRRSDRQSTRFDDGYAPRRPPPREDRQRAPAGHSRYDDDDYDRRADRRDGPSVRRSRSDARPARDRYDERGQRAVRGGRDRDGKGGDKRKEYAQQAGALFMTHAMPMIKREGSKWAKRELQNFMAQKR